MSLFPFLNPRAAVTWLEPVPPRPEYMCFFTLFAMLPTRLFAGIAHRASLHSQVSLPPVCVSVLSHFLQTVRRYASAAPTAAFAGQKGSNVRLCTRLLLRLAHL